MLSKYAFVTLIILYMTSSCQQIDTPDQLKQSIENTLKRSPGEYAVAFKDLGTGETILINAKASFHAASTMKTPVMIEVFKQAAAGRFALTDSFMVKNEFRSIVDSSTYQLDSADDSDHDIYKHIGQPATLLQLVTDMITKSSNLATNMVIELVDARNVTQTMRELGAMDIKVLRGVEDNKAFQQGLNNSTTAYDLMLIFEKMAAGKTVGQSASDSMIHILLDQHFNAILPARLPKDVKVAHKTGNITGVEHDGGIVFLPDGRKYVLVLLSKDLKDEAAAKKMLAGISEKVYTYVDQHTKKAN